MSDTLRVAHVITQLELGGAQQNTLYTVQHLDRRHYTPLLLCGRGGMLDDEAMQSDFALHFVPSLVRPIDLVKDLAAAMHLYRLLRVLRPHIVHTHSSKAGILGRIAAYLAGVPVIIHTFHGFGFTPAQKPFVRNLYIRAERFCARLATQLIFVSRDNQEEAKALGIGVGKPMTLIRSGIHRQPAVSANRKQLRAELAIPDDAPLVITVGNFKPQKNPMDLARVATQVLKAHPEAHFLFIGDGELRPKVEAYVQSQTIQSQVHFLGWRRDTDALYAASDIYLLTSLWEGLPRSLLEASVAGLPSVAYAVNGVRDVLEEGENGFLIQPGDVVKTGEQVTWLIEHPKEARAMGAEARQLIHKDFDIDEMVRQQEALYHECWDEVPLKEYYEPLWSLP